MTYLKIITLGLYACALQAYGQNLVPNPGFESYSELPNSWSQWHRCDSWTNAGGSAIDGAYGNPDYFHLDGEGPAQLPDTPPAVVDPHSGSAVMGFLGWHEPYGGSEIREYLMAELTEPMTIGTTYTISFWITSGSDEIGHYYKCDGIGVNLSTAPFDQDGSSPILQTPELEIEGQLFTTNWEKQTFTFTADSAYTHLTIGNFYSDAETNFSVEIAEPRPFPGAYYFVDDFIVEEYVDVTSAPTSTFEPLSIYSDPIHDLIKINGNNFSTNAEYEIYTTNGRLVLSGLITDKQEILLESISAGVYIIIIKSNEQLYKQQFVKL